MRNLRRNQQPVFFRLYEDEQEIVDQYGNPSGSYYPIYGELKSAMLCVSPNKGSSEATQFGTFTEYDRTMTTADSDCEIDENAVLWIDGADTDGPWNYVVKRAARWKNSAQYAIQQVNVSEYEQYQKTLDLQSKIRSSLEPEVTENAQDQDEA